MYVGRSLRSTLSIELSRNRPSDHRPHADNRVTLRGHFTIAELLQFGKQEYGDTTYSSLGEHERNYSEYNVWWLQLQFGGSLTRIRLPLKGH